MKILWCWRCKAEIPMLDEDEWVSVWNIYKSHSDKHRDGRAAALARHQQLTGFTETNFNALFHHRISLFGPPCPRCGKVLRTPKASKCFECGLRVQPPQ